MELDEANRTYWTSNIGTVKRQRTGFLDTKAMSRLGTKNRRFLEATSTDPKSNLADLTRSSYHAEAEGVRVEGQAAITGDTETF